MIGLWNRKNRQTGISWLFKGICGPCSYAFAYFCTKLVYDWCNSLEWKVFNFFESIVRWSVPIFVMISGSLFLGREIPLRKMYSKYIFRMVIFFSMGYHIRSFYRRKYRSQISGSSSRTVSYVIYFDDNRHIYVYAFYKTHRGNWYKDKVLSHLYTCVCIRDSRSCNFGKWFWKWID